jgi:two-component system response regulator MprA
MQLTKPRILIVEDDHALRDILMYALSKEDCEVVVTETAEEGLKVVNDVDMVLLNLHLPKMSGEDFLRTVRYNGNYVPIIIVTASMNRAEGLEKFRDHQIVEFVEKPFRTDNVVRIVKKAMEVAGHMKTVEGAVDEIDTFIRKWGK